MRPQGLQPSLGIVRRRVSALNRAKAAAVRPQPLSFFGGTMQQVASIFVLGALIFAAVLALTFVLARVYGLQPQRIVLWLLAAGFLCILAGAVVQSASRGNVRDWQLLLHQAGACLVLSALVLHVAMRRLEGGLAFRKLTESRRLTIGRETQVPLQAAPGAVKQLQQIEHCVFDGVRMTHAWGRLLVQMRKLSELDLRRADLDPSIISWLTCLTQLDVLRISSSSFTTRELRMIQVALPACRVEVEDGVLVDHLTPEGRVRRTSEEGELPEAAADKLERA